MSNLHRRTPAARRAQAGLSMVELLIAVTLGLLLMAGLAAIFANTSSARNELERNARQIENGRFAMELLTDDLRLAGFYGEYQLAANAPIAAVPDPCSTDPIEWKAAMPIAVQHYDNVTGVPPCIIGSFKANTDVVVIRRASTCEAGVGTCPAALAGRPYIQVKKCATQTPLVPFLLDRMGSVPFDLQLRNCSGISGQREYLIRAYYIANDNGRGLAIPTLTRVDFNGADWDRPVALVEGIEELNIEYGLDLVGQPGNPAQLDGQPDVYSANPAAYVSPGCPSCTPVSNLTNIVTARVHLLARNLEESPRYTDNKTYSLGTDAGGMAVTVTPGGPYRRHAYSGIVRIVNVSQRRERP